jgi:hypothetical protein
MSPALRAIVLAFAALLDHGPALAASTWENARQVKKEEIVAAMRRQKDLKYKLDAIANAVRLQAGVFLELAEKAQAADPERRPLRVGHEEYFTAFLEVTGLTSDSAPTFARVPHRFGEDHLIDYRREHVLEPIEAGAVPLRALNVKAGWPSAPGAPASYSYVDKSADPHVEVTHQQASAHRVLDFGNIIVYDDIRGVTGRATSGLLGLIFSLLGTAQAEQTRFAVSADDIQLSRTTATKLLTLTHTVTIYPDGEVLSGLPPDRPDLERLERHLKRLDIKAVYVPFDLSPVPPPGDTPP